MTTLADVAAMTDIDRVTRMVADGANRLRALELEAEAAFKQWVAAADEAEKIGLPTEIRLGAGMQTALAEYRGRMSKGEARLMVDEEFGRDVIVATEEARNPSPPERDVWDEAR